AAGRPGAAAGSGETCWPAFPDACPQGKLLQPVSRPPGQVAGPHLLGERRVPAAAGSGLERPGGSQSLAPSVRTCASSFQEGRTMLPIHTILPPTAFSPRSHSALHLACALARDYNARLVVLHVTVQPTVAYGEGV